MQKHTQTEAKLESVLQAVRAYSQIAGNFTDIVDLETRISRAWAETSKEQLTFEACSLVLGRRLGARDCISRWGAWLAGRLFNGRTTCVGNHIVQLRDDTYHCPLVEQLRHYGLPARPVFYRGFVENAKKAKYKKKIDGLIIKAAEPELIVIKTAQLNRQASPEAASLFNPSPRSVPKFAAPAGAVASLTLSEMILRTAMPHVPVRCILLLVDPEITSREFYAFETTGTALQQITKPLHDLSGLTPIASAQALLAEGVDIETLAAPPELVSREALMRLPVDRATRAMMILEVMWAKQAASQGLATTTVADLATEVEQRFLIEYTTDHQRHDLEDCLETGGFIERPTYEDKCYALTPIGVFQAIVQRRLLKNQARPVTSEDGEPHLLAPIRKQARLWARYHAGDQVIDAQ